MVLSWCTGTECKRHHFSSRVSMLRARRYATHHSKWPRHETNEKKRPTWTIMLYNIVYMPRKHMGILICTCTMHNAHAQGGTVDRKRWLHRFILHSARRATGQDDLVDNAYSTTRTSHILRHRDLCDTVLSNTSTMLACRTHPLFLSLRLYLLFLIMQSPVCVLGHVT